RRAHRDRNRPLPGSGRRTSDKAGLTSFSPFSFLSFFPSLTASGRVTRDRFGARMCTPSTIHSTINGRCPHMPRMKRQSRKPPTRSTYRHGDLRRALLESGIALAQSGGPDAVVEREATRRAGVVPNAAYRHFASHMELLQAVRMTALSRLALAMEVQLDALSSALDPAELARGGLRG